ncbi:hypothetical protein [uncultured Tyzzerella sp.]|uniref:hypothetical protein n=1 Tax=uncultured Tyzzerella sp. TaxID=2321398 RepID=UPI00294370CB|nr:hypothetical protein [uncultured Tyzzerella sp.]
MLEKLKIKITILASLIVTAYAYLYKIDFLKTCYTIIVTIVVFYLIGGFIELFLQKQIEEIKENKNFEEENFDEIEEVEEIINTEDDSIQ